MGVPGEDPGHLRRRAPTGAPYSMPIELLGDEDRGVRRSTPWYAETALPPGLTLDRTVPASGHADAGRYVYASTSPVHATTVPRPPARSRAARPTTEVPDHHDQSGASEAHDRPGVDGAGDDRDAVRAADDRHRSADAKTWTINSGSLPTGLVLDANTGLISGTPTATGQYTFEVRAKVNADTRADTKVLGHRHPGSARDRRGRAVLADAPRAR